jgi:hypothetical protein
MFIISPRIGLCNQIYCIVKGILLGIKYNRNIYINKFQINLYDANNLCNIKEILNIDKINNFLTNNNINIKILENIDESILKNLEKYKVNGINYSDPSKNKNINNYINNNLNKDILYLGNTISLCIYESFNYLWDDYNNLYYFIMSNLVFNDKFYEIKDSLKKQLNLVKYASVHLRIEDDAIKHFSGCYNLSLHDYNNKLIQFYNNKIKNINEPIYISSGILNFDNKINYNYYKELTKNNNLICDKENIVIDDFIFKNRELIALVDLLICFDSEEFIGCDCSSFSQVIKAYLIHKKIDKTKISLFFQL